MYLFSGDRLGPFSFTCIALGCSIVSGLGAVLVGAWAERLGLVSRHRRDRFGGRRVPLTGGVGLFLGVSAGVLVLGAPLPAAWIVATAGFFLAGLLDDRFEFAPALKFSLQAAVALTAASLWPGGVVATGLLVLLMLVSVNVSNYLDNMDGLLSGVALTQALALVFLSAEAGPGATLLVWALPAVLFLTLPPARIYLGDSGSHLIGALLAIDAGRLLMGPEGVRGRFFVPLLLVFAVPIWDAVFVTVSRLRRGRPVFRGGTDHTSHYLVRRGASVPRAVLFLVLASGVCCVASVLLVRW